MFDDSPRPSPRIIGAIWLAYFVLSGIGASLTQDGPMAANLTESVSRIVDHQSVYRAGLGVTLIANGLYIVLSAFLYGLFARINRSVALAAALLSVTGCIVQIVAAVLQWTPIVLHGDAALAATLTPEQLRTTMLLSLKVYRQTFSVSLPMFALFNLFLGFLIYRSRYLPRVFAAFFFVAGSAWIISMWSPSPQPFQYLSLASSGLAEVGTSLWLVIKSVDISRWRTAAASEGSSSSSG